MSLPERGNPWEKLVRRADRLATYDGASEPVVFYAQLLRLQSDFYRFLNECRPTGTLESDLESITDGGRALLRSVATFGPEPLRRRAESFLRDPLALHGELREYRRTRSAELFFPKALLQPYFQWLIRAGATGDAGVSHRPGESAERRCPWCGGSPQLVWFDPEGAGTGARRRLLCATCLTNWPCRRVVCVACGVEDERQLSAYSARELPHVRVDTCERCRTYIKTIDLSRLGLAEPLVDEVAAGALDVWARERDYRKIELNLVGL